MTENLLTIRDLKVEFAVPGGTVEALRGVDLDLPRGRITALVGESGSGKSVMAQAVMGLLPRVARISGGSILLAAADQGEGQEAGQVLLSDLAPKCDAYRALRGGRIAQVFQEPMTALSPVHTIGAQLQEAAELHPTGTPINQRITDILQEVGFPDVERAAASYPFELSGGLRQRAVIALALIGEPELLIADEPTTALDVTVQAQILRLLARLQAARGLTLLLITHDLGVVAGLADEMVVLYRGQVVEAGPARALITAPEHGYLQGLLKAVPNLGLGATGERLTPLRPVDPPDLPAQDHVIPADAPDTLVQVRDVSRSFTIKGLKGRQVIRAVQSVSLDLRRGGCLGLVGESGSGKTTLCRLMLGALTADHGSALYDDGVTRIDLCCGDEKALREIRRKVSFVFQDPFSALNPRMTVKDLLTEPLKIHRMGDRTSRDARAAELMRLVGLDPAMLSRYPHGFSGGQRQRLAIARALATAPELVILDEPTSALDVSVQAQILNLLKDLQAGLGLTLMVVSHNLAVIDYMADQVAVMAGGRIVEQAPRNAIFNRAQHPYTQSLIAAIPDLDPDRSAAALQGDRPDQEDWPDGWRLGAEEAGDWIEIDPGHHVLKSASAKVVTDA
ncbi:MAG: ABC transporter ATP-binding protein [Alphaproteobacteria bacterium]